MKLTPTEQRRLRESIKGDDPMLRAEAEAAYEAALDDFDEEEPDHRDRALDAQGYSF